MKRILTISRTTEAHTCAVRMSQAYRETIVSNETEVGSEPEEEDSGNVVGSDLTLRGIFTQLDDWAARLQTAINRSKTESELEEKDEIRDDQYRSLFHLIEGLLYYPDPAIVGEAKKVYVVLDKYGLSAAGENYAVESALIGSLLEDLSAEDLQPSIGKLAGCAERIATLQAAQDEFMTVQKRWDLERAKEGNQENATSVKKELLKVINNELIVYLQGMFVADAAGYGPFMDVIDRIIADNNEVVRARREKNDKEKTGEEEG